MIIRKSLALNWLGGTLSLVFALLCCGQSQVFGQDKTQNQKSAAEAARAKSEAKPEAKGSTSKVDQDAKKKTSASEEKAKKKDSAENQSWPVFRGDAGSTGLAQSELPKDLEVVWEYKIPKGKGAFEGTPVIARHSKTKEPIAYIGDLDGKLFAFNLDTGEVKWAKQLTVTRKDGKEHTSFSFSSSPAYRDGRIFVGDIDGVFYCVNEDGDLEWHFEAEAEISSSPNFYKGNVLFGSQDSKLYLLNSKTGEQIFAHETPDQIRCSITVAEDRAFVAGCDGYFHIVDFTTGKEAGKVDIKSPTQSTPAMLGDHVYFGTEQDAFMALNWKTAEGIWTFSDKEGQASVRGCAAVTEGHVVFGARNTQVYSVHPKTGKQNWTTVLDAKVDSSPVIVGDRVFVGSTDGRFYALSLEKGEKIWEKQFKGSLIGSPAVAFGKLVIATDRGVVYCLGKKQP